MTSDAELVSWGRPKNGGDVVSFWFGAGGKIHLGVWAGKVSGSTQINDGQWHHVAATVQENSTISYPDVTLYVDGQDDTIPSTGARSINLYSQYDVTIGRQINDAVGFYDGLIDDVRIYDHVLTADEIRALAVPEPATIVLLGLGGALFRKRR